MQIESHATPPSSSPQLRYAALHRALERGLASDEVWRELAEVSLQLGHHDESVRSVRSIENVTLRKAMESRLDRLGLRPEAKMSVRGLAPADQEPSGLIAGDIADHEETPPGKTTEHLADALQYLLLQHMPVLALVTTLSFPVLVGLGGFLTSGGSFLLLAGIAALPGLMVLSLVGAMGRRILRNSYAGSNDVPAVGDLGGLFDDAQRFVVDTGLVLVSFIAPPVVALLLGAPLETSIPGLVIGGLLAPMAWVLRSLRGDFASLSPVVLMRAVTRRPLQYVELAIACWALFAPAALTTWMVMDRPIWVQIAMVGPMAVLPFFVASRLLGTWFETRRNEFGALLVDQRPKRAATAEASSNAPRKAAAQQPERKRVRARAPQPDPSSPRLPPRPDRLRYYEARDVHESRTAQAPDSVRRAASDPRPANAKRTQAAAQRREIEGRTPQRAPATPTDGPDLSAMPGAVVVKGSDRQRRGAAARPN